MDERWDVAVVGGGLSGALAALAAAREGRKTLLIEKYGFLGGAAVAALVNPFMHYRTANRRINNAGLFQTLLDRLDSMGALHANRTTFNEQLLCIALDDLLREAGVQVLLHAQLRAVHCAQEADGTRISELLLQGLSGQEHKIVSSIFVDATGDGDLIALSGAPFQIGRDTDHACQPMTLCLRIGGIDMQKLEDAARSSGFSSYQAFMNDVFRQAKADGELAIPREDILSFPTMLPGVMHFNTTRVLGKNSLSSESFTEAEQEGRRQAYAFYRFLRGRIPGFEGCVLLQLAPQTGVRESRRFVGKYVLRGEDVIACRKFKSGIARACYGVDIHNPNGEGTQRQRMTGDAYHTIPMECLYSDAYQNLVVTGRPISSDHTAHSAIRVMPICASLGEAAGILAAQGAPQSDVRRVAYADVQRVLVQHGGVY